MSSLDSMQEMKHKAKIQYVCPVVPQTLFLANETAFTLKASTKTHPNENF